jgi:hypothetical protein
MTKIQEMQRQRERERWLDEVAAMVEETYGEGLEVVSTRFGAAVIDEDGNEVEHYDHD